MENKRYIDYVDVFWGSEVFSKQSDGKLSDKWFFFKPQTGNLSPACCLPNQALTVVPYSGGYPTGYGIYNPSYAAVPTTFAQKKFIRGFTHFCHSGTGFINNFYNYFMICPSSERQDILSEEGGCGWYQAVTPAYTARAALDGKSANYEFELKEGKTITILPYFGGLDNGSKRCKVYRFPYTMEELGGAAVFCVDIDGLPLYFAVASKKKFILEKAEDNYKMTFESDDISLSVSYSFVSAEEARERVKASCFDFNKAKEVAGEIWNEALSVADIQADERTKALFYTALYNATKKPCLDSGFITPVFDLATMWDMYKTQLPMMFMLYPQKASAVVNGLAGCFRDGRFFNSKLMEKGFRFSMQAVSLISVAIATAYQMGVKADYEKLFALAKRDVEFHAARAKFFKPYVTHNLDLIDAYYALTACGVNFDERVKAAIYYRENNLYARNGLLKRGFRRKFYEGTFKNYSFRVASSTDARLAGCDKESLAAELDSFFGFVGSPVKVFTTPTGDKEVSRYGKRYLRFEGMNNQPDMETMYMYHKLGLYHKCEDVVNELIAHNFNLTKGGIPGNDDSGGLTSWLALNILGLFPVAGTGKILIGSPQTESAKIRLEGILTVKSVGKEQGKHIKKVYFNGKELESRQIDFVTLKQGGELLIEY